MRCLSLDTLVVLTLCPVLQLHPERSGSTLHSSPSRQGSIWHHHFCRTMEAVGAGSSEGSSKFSASTACSCGRGSGLCRIRACFHTPWL